MSVILLRYLFKRCISSVLVGLFYVWLLRLQVAGAVLRKQDGVIFVNMNLYENIFIGRQDLSQQQMEALGVSLGLCVGQNDGEVVRSEYCGFRNLAYPIKKNHKGHYYIIQMKAPAATVTELDRIMKINEDIIRHLIVKVESFDDREILISQAKTFNDDFGQPRDRGYRGSVAKGDFVDEVDKVEESSVAG